RAPLARARAAPRAHRLHAVRRLADPRLRAALHQMSRPFQRPRGRERRQGRGEGGPRPCPGRDRGRGRAVPMRRLRRRTPPALPPLLCRWDLDKTYLRSEFDSLRQLLRTAFERGEDKVDVPGVAALIKAIKAAAERRGRGALVHFVSASPPQIGRAIRDKLTLDGVPYDGIVFKNQLANIRRGKLRNLREHVGFKLVELFRGRLAAPAESRELLFGDDWESDSLIYSLYAALLACRLDADAVVPILRRIGVDPLLVDEAVALAGRAAGPDAVDRIFINLERRTPPATFRLFGPRVVPTFNYFQTAVVLAADAARARELAPRPRATRRGRAAGRGAPHGGAPARRRAAAARSVAGAVATDRRDVRAPSRATARGGRRSGA